MALVSLKIPDTSNFRMLEKLICYNVTAMLFRLTNLKPISGISLNLNIF